MRLIYILLIISIFFSCTEKNIEYIGDNNIIDPPHNLPVPGSINRHLCIPTDPLIKVHCAPPRRDCFDDVIVEAPRPVEEHGILLGHILNNTVYIYFNIENQNNYEILFPGICGQPLLDLRNNLTTLREIVAEDGITITYYLVLTADTNSTPDYSIY